MASKNIQDILHLQPIDKTVESNNCSREISEGSVTRSFMSSLMSLSVRPFFNFSGPHNLRQHAVELVLYIFQHCYGLRHVGSITSITIQRYIIVRNTIYSIQILYLERSFLSAFVSTPYKHFLEYNVTMW